MVGELLVNTPSGRKKKPTCLHCEGRDSQACGRKPSYVFAGNMVNYQQSCQ